MASGWHLIAEVVSRITTLKSTIHQHRCTIQIYGKLVVCHRFNGWAEVLCMYAKSFTARMYWARSKALGSGQRIWLMQPCI